MGARFMMARLRRWLGLGAAPDAPRGDGRPPGVPAADSPSAEPETGIPVPDDASIARFYVESLFRMADRDGSALSSTEREWLREHRERLRGQDTSFGGLVPRLPAAMPRLMAATRDPERTSARELARMIESDPVLAANVLKVVNSPAMRMRSEAVDSLEQAVVIMGFPGMREVIAAATISPIASFDTDPRLDAAAIRQVWAHTLEAAVAVRDAAARTSPADAFELYLAGLSHSSGLMVLLRCLKSLDDVRPSSMFPGELEALARRYSAAVARDWAFPKGTVEALDQWAEGRDTPGAAVLNAAVVCVRAGALAESGTISGEQLEVIRHRLPGFGEDRRERRDGHRPSDAITAE
ncbi:hypothetical protein B1C78_10335 [Thioalkalivibrio denitrificans]|uniref:HDOD domain-containing protein n=1 Tax=Thioalkalivibrio denitrificans TaxID=108003 RepID=A0A1V3NF00_9GAMM|nr:hypothetical protein B1C78_10335 [Thioalkalivibrio denitrificans]